MIPVKIMTFEEAKNAGLANEGSDFKGESVMGAMCVAGAGPDKKVILLEKYFLKTNGEKELVFMHKDRMEDLKKKEGRFEEYINQFETIKGIDRQKYIKDNKLIIVDQEI